MVVIGTEMNWQLPPVSSNFCQILLCRLPDDQGLLCVILIRIIVVDVSISINYIHFIFFI